MLKKILPILLLPFALMGCWGDDKDDKKLIVGSSMDNPPFEFFRNGESVGFDIELIRMVADRMGYEVEVRDMSFDGLLGSLQSGRVDLVIAALGVTPERRKAVDFSDPYYKADWAVVCQTNVNLESAEDFKGKVIGVQLGASFEPYLKREFAPKYGVTIRSLNKIPDLIQDMRAGRITYFVASKSVADAIARGRSDLKSIVITQYVDEGVYETFSIALPKGSELTDKVNKALGELRAEGRLADLETAWFTNMDRDSDSSPNT